MLAAPPVLLAPVEPVIVRRAYRAAAPFAAGGRRVVLLRAMPGVAVGAPCDGRVTFRGRVAAAPPVLSVRCAASGVRVTVSRLRTSARAGQRVAAGGTLGSAGEGEIGLSVRVPGRGYVDPVPLLRVPAGDIRLPPVAPAKHRPAAREPKAPALPQVRLLRAVRTAPSPPVLAQQAGHARAAPPDRVLGGLGAGLGLAAVLWAAARARVTRRRAASRAAVQRVAARR